jgi:hypothetical protein
LESGVAPWVKPWRNGNTGGILPMNAATKRSYNGINIPILWHAPDHQRVQNSLLDDLPASVGVGCECDRVGTNRAGPAY